MNTIAKTLLNLLFPTRRKPRIYVDSATFDPFAAPKEGSALILSARNEEKTIYARVKSAQCDAAGVVVIDQGSTDGTSYRAAEAGAVVILQDGSMSSEDAKRKAIRAAKAFSSSVQFVENCQ